MMMTGMPPPRTYTWHWNISRMTDKTFSQELREIVADMLRDEPQRRPGAVEVCDRIATARKV